MWRRAKLRTNILLNPGDDDSHTLDSFIIILIALCVVAVMLETEPATAEQYEGAFWVFEVFSSIFFTIEYVLRLWVCTEDERYRHPVWGRLRYALTPAKNRRSGSPANTSKLLAVKPRVGTTPWKSQPSWPSRFR